MNNFLDYFHNEWVVKLPGWYEGYVAPNLCIPSQNQALEAIKKHMKDGPLQYTKQPLGDFLEIVQDDLTCL